MVPVTGGPLSNQTLTQTTAHLLDTTAHSAEILLPLRKESRVIEDLASNAGAIGRRVRNLRALQDRQLASDVGVGSGGIGAGCGDEVESTSTLTVETEVLGEGLGDAQLEALLDEVADRPCVAGQVAGREALVCGVEEGEVAALAHDGGDLLPLVLGWVDAGGVVGTGVQQDDGACRRRPQRLQHAVEVKALGRRREVGVVGQLQADVGEDLVVIGPCRVGEVDGGLLGVELGQEETAQMDSAGSRNGLQGTDLRAGETLVFGAPLSYLGRADGLGSTYPFLANRGAIAADDELLCCRGETGQTADGEVLVVEGRVVVNGVISLELLAGGH